jgi:ATP-binding cassette subfamily C protein LapB
MTGLVTESSTASGALAIIRGALWRRKGVFVSAIVATATVNLLALATSLYSMQVYDRVIPRSGFDTLWVLTVGVVIALLLDFALRTARALLVEREAARIDAEVSQVFFDRMQGVRLDARPAGVGTIAAQLRGWEQVRALFSSASIFLLADLPFAVIFIIAIAWLGGIISVVPLLALPIAFGLAFVFAALIRADAERAQLNGNRRNGLLVETLDAAEMVKAANGRAELEARWQRLNAELIGHEEPIKRWSSIANSVFATMQQLTYVLVVAWGAVEVSRGAMTMGALIACTILAGRVNGPLIAQLPGFLIQWSYSRSALRALDGLLALPQDAGATEQPLAPARIEPSYRVENLAFAYPGAGEGGLNIPRLTIKPGERVALIGGIGAGKSTFLKVLAGLYAPTSGLVRIGGLDIQQIAPDVLRAAVGYLPQDTRLLDGTLRDNLQLGLGQPDDETLIGALKAVGLDSMVAAHPRGIDLPISEGGRGLSGGQRMLASLARMLVLDPEVWLLDEPTANLDQVSEARILGELARRVTGERTLVFATHRLRNLALSTRVIVLHDGKVALDGPTDEILKKLTEQAQAAPVGAAAAVGV